jgi:hypothetical protein
MHHPTQFQAEANIRQQERLQQAAAHRAAREANRGRPGWTGALLWPFRLLIALLKLVPAVLRLVPRSRQPEPGLDERPLLLDRK